MCAMLAINGATPTVPKGLQKAWPPITQDDIDAVINVLKSGVLWGPMEEQVLGLQDDFAKYIGAKHALVVNSGKCTAYFTFIVRRRLIAAAISWMRGLARLPDLK